MNRVLRIFVCTLLMLAGSPTLMAQDVEMADTMRSEGKIYVVVAIILIVLAGLIFYLFSLDRKIKKVEDNLKK